MFMAAVVAVVIGSRISDDNEMIYARIKEKYSALDRKLSWLNQGGILRLVVCGLGMGKGIVERISTSF